MSEPTTTDDSDLRNVLLQSPWDISRGGSSHDVREGLDAAAFETLLKAGTSCTRKTVGNKDLTYVLDIAQQPERSRACGSGSKSSADRRPIDPPPVLSLLVFERRDGRQIDVTFSYEAKFFLFATVEGTISQRNGIYSQSNPQVPVLSGCPVSSGNYLFRPDPAIYFLFDNLSVIYEGNYRLCFNLYEMTSNPDNGDDTGGELDIGNKGQEHYTKATTPRDEFIWRTEIKSAMFRVFGAKDFASLSENIPFRRALAGQGVRLRRIYVRMRSRSKLSPNLPLSGFEEPHWDEPIYGEPGFKDDEGASLWNDSGYGLRNGSVSPTGTFRDRLMSPVVAEYPLPTPSISSHQQNSIDVERERTLLLLTEEELRRNSISEPNAHKSWTTSTWIDSQCSSLVTKDDKSQQDGYDSEISTTADLAQLNKTKDARRHPEISQKGIWSNFVKLLPPAIRAKTMEFDDSSLEPSIALADGEPLSHAVKRASHEWWLAYPSQPWEDILPQESQTISYVHLSHTIFLSWYRNFISGVHGSHDAHGNWLDFIRPLLYQDSDAFLNEVTEVKLVEQLVDDIYRRLDKDVVSHVRQNTSGASSSAQGSASGNTDTPPATYQPARDTAKRCHGDDSEPGDKSNDDGSNKDDKVKRRKKNADQYSRYLICTEFAASQDPACPNCFFGAWPTVDRLKQDHLIKVHKFDSTLLKIGKGGSESDKWWRLFDKLHPGFREANPNTFIPGACWEDRVAHNAYNKILSAAMKETEGIRQRSTQALSSQFQDLLDQRQSVERQELRQMVSNLMSSNNKNLTAVNHMTPEPESERQLQSAQIDTHNGNGMITHLLKEADATSAHLLTSGTFDTPSSSDIPDPLYALDGPLPDSYLQAFNDHTSPRYPVQDNFGTGTHPALISPASVLPEAPGNQTNPHIITTSTITAPETSHLVGMNLSFVNSHAHQEAFGKVCRCRFHSSECTKSSTQGENEWCVGCSGWFPWSAMAEPFFHC